KLQAHADGLPAGASAPLIKARSIDDVPILALTFHSQRYDHLALRRLAAQVDAEIKHVPEVSETTLIGGYRRQVRIQLDPPALASPARSPRSRSRWPSGRGATPSPWPGRSWPRSSA